MSKRFTESDVEEAALEWFEELHYEIATGPTISPGGENEERKSYQEFILIERLKTALKKINPASSDDVLEIALRKIVSPNSPNLIVNNHNFHKMITDGIEIEYLKNGEKKTDQVWLIDFENKHNDFLAVNQFTITENRQRRPDIMIFLNGLPVGIIELKNPGDENATTRGAYNQVQITYKKDIPSLFTYNEIIVISDGIDTRIGTTTTTWDRFTPWRIIDIDRIESDSIPQLEVAIKGIFQQERLLDMLTNFIVFEIDEKETIKKIASYHQYKAVIKAVNSTLNASSLNGDKKIGVVWHSTGSGKSLSMIFFSGKVIAEDVMQNPTIVVLTDRNDLDSQLFESFFKNREIIRQEPEQADSRKDLRKLLAVTSGGVVFTTVHKFVPEKGETAPLLSDRRNIVVIADEAHRSQYDFIDGFARHIRDSLPNASYVGFTATPIETGDKNTRGVFGDYVDQYDMIQSVEDGFTVPITYESRHSKLKLSTEFKFALDSSFDSITENHEEEERKKLQSKWGRLESAVGSDKNIKQMADDLVEHFENRLTALNGKGMIVCMSRRICVDLYEQIIKINPDWHDTDYKKGMIKVVMTGSASDPENFQPHLTTKKIREQIKERLKDPDDPLKLVIVRDMWLAGFDAPVLHTMYIAKPMHSHGLIQAISRVNRVFKGKPAGLIVDHISLGFDIKKALDEYTKASKEKVALPLEEAVLLLERKYKIVKDFLLGYDYSLFFSGKASDRLKIISGSMSHILEQEDGKKKFSLSVMQLVKTFALCGSDKKAMGLRNEIEFFQTIKASFVKNTGSKTVDTEEVDSKIRDLVSKAIEPIGVIDLLKESGIKKVTEISVLSDEFLQEVKGMKYKNMAIELLSKLLRDEIKHRERKNTSQARLFSDMLDKALLKYESRTIQSVQVIAELIEISKQIRDARKRGEKLKLSDEELAFYDALEVHDNTVKMLGDENLCRIARELLNSIRENVSIDWSLKETSRAKLRSLVKRTLTKYGYPAEKKESATDTILNQAELINWII